MGRALSVAMLLVLASGVALALGHWFPEVASIHGIGVQRMLNFTLPTTAPSSLGTRGLDAVGRQGAGVLMLARVERGGAR